MKNKIIAHLTIILILVGVFCNVCTTYNRISIYDSSVYAEADNWTSCDTSDLVTAFRYYCKSRNLALQGSVADALTTFTTSTFNNICSTLGIDPTSLSAELKKTTEGNLGLRYLFSNTGITAYNRIFSEFLQNNDLSVGDEVDNKVIQSGKYYTDSDGYGCFVYVVDPTIASDQSYYFDKLYKRGTPYKYNLEELRNMSIPTTLNFNLNNSITSLNLTGSTLNADSGVTFESPFNVRILSNRSIDNFRNVSGLNGYYYYQGVPAIIDGNGTYLLFAVFIDVYEYRNTGYFKNNLSTSDANDHYFIVSTVKRLSNVSLPEEEVTVNTPDNTVINNNTYNNNYVIIYNDGDTYISDDDDEPLPTTPPSGGGGGGGDDNPTNPDNPDIPPVDPTPTPNPTIPDWDIELPEMPTGNDWLLYGLEKKFPWDIPFNLMYMLSLFAADPETPHFEGTLDLKIVQWNYDIDLAPFDDIAGYVRNIEFIGFLIGLMLLTNKLIWG